MNIKFGILRASKERLRALREQLDDVQAAIVESGEYNERLEQEALALRQRIEELEE